MAETLATIPLHHRELAQIMLWQLESKKLSVSLAPTGDGRQIRVVEVSSPKWYQDFCGRYRAGRKKQRQSKKHDTLIKRQLTLKALRSLVDGQNHTIYTQRLTEEIEMIAAQLQNNPNKLEEIFYG